MGSAICAEQSPWTIMKSYLPAGAQPILAIPLSIAILWAISKRFASPQS